MCQAPFRAWFTEADASGICGPTQHLFYGHLLHGCQEVVASDSLGHSCSSDHSFRDNSLSLQSTFGKDCISLVGQINGIDLGVTKAYFSFSDFCKHPISYVLNQCLLKTY